MADIVSLEHYREARLQRPAKRDPEKAEVFPGVSLADLWRIWAACDAKRLQAEPTGSESRL